MPYNLEKIADIYYSDFLLFNAIDYFNFLLSRSTNKTKLILFSQKMHHIFYKIIFILIKLLQFC